MSLLKIFKKVSKVLKDNDCQFAVAGGLAANIYRKKLRITNDVDIALFAGTNEKTKKLADKIIKDVGYESAAGWIPTEDKRIKSSVPLVIGRKTKNSTENTIDFLLPTLPWVEVSVERAQLNPVDFGFGELPTLTPEDIIIAKTFALSIDDNRFNDLDDLKEIFSKALELDLTYLNEQFNELNLEVPKSLHKIAPESLRKISKRN